MIKPIKKVSTFSQSNGRHIFFHIVSFKLTNAENSWKLVKNIEQFSVRLEELILVTN